MFDAEYPASRGRRAHADLLTEAAPARGGDRRLLAVGA
jgi:hypothetical protein